LGKNTEFDMPEMLFQLLHRVSVARGGVGVYAGGAAAVDAILDNEGRIADLECFAEQAELGPRGDAFNVDLGAEAALVARRADGGFEGTEGAEADQADDLGLVVAKTVILEIMEGGRVLP